MNDFRNWREERREQRRKMREEWRARFGDHQHYMAGSYVRSSGVWTGVFILLIGVAALVKATVTDLPNWFFSWQTFLIALGLFTGIKHGFRGATWFILILIGGAFLVPHIYPDIDIRRYIWPVVLIIIGAFIILKPRRRYWGDDLNDNSQKKSSASPDIEDAKIVDETSYSKEDFVHATSVFGGVKKIVISKNFKGGDLVNIFGGSELDLTRCDFNGTATIELTNIFGGTKLIIPADWAVKSDAAVIFGGVEDKRHISGDPAGNAKTLLLKGTVIFGGVDIRNY
jgi:predicted membrane protein